MSGQSPFVMVPVSLIERCRNAAVIHLYALLKKRANRENRAWPDTAWLMTQMNTSRSGLLRATRQLRQLGYIVTRRRHRADGAVVGLDYLIVNPDHMVKSDLMVTGDAPDRQNQPSIEEARSTDLDPITLKAEPPGRRLEIPTRDQVTKLVFAILDDPGVELTCEPDLKELVKRACARADFLYDTVVVNDGINRALAARGLNPMHTVDFRRARRYAHVR